MIVKETLSLFIVWSLFTIDTYEPNKGAPTIFLADM